MMCWSTEMTDQLAPGRYTSETADITQVEAVVVDHEYAELVYALVPDSVDVYSEDEFTTGRSEFNLIVEHEGIVDIATQVGTHIFHDSAILDARLDSTSSFSDWLTSTQYDRTTTVE